MIEVATRTISSQLSDTLPLNCEYSARDDYGLFGGWLLANSWVSSR